MTRANYIACAFVIGTLAALTARASFAQSKEPESKAEEQARLARKSAGVIVGSWGQIDSPAGGTTTVDDSPIGIGYFRKGHRQAPRRRDDGRCLAPRRHEHRVRRDWRHGGWKDERAAVPAVHVAQALSGHDPRRRPRTIPLRWSRIHARVPEFVGRGGGVLGGGGASGLIVGVGGSGGAGVEWRLSQAFGLALGGHYAYVQFFDDLAGQRMYRGTGVNAGITYRFQY